MKKNFNRIRKIKIINFIKRNVEYFTFLLIALISLVVSIVSGLHFPKKAFILYDLSIGIFTSLFIIMVTELFRNKYLKNKLLEKYKVKYISFAGAIGKYMNQKQWVDTTHEELYFRLFNYCEEMNSFYNTLKTFENDKNATDFLKASRNMYMEFYIKFINDNQNFNLSNFFDEKNYKKALSVFSDEEKNKNALLKFVIEENKKAKKQEEIENKLFEYSLD